MDAVTAVSGSGPAYVFLLTEALAQAGTAAGLPADLAARLARATVAGSGELLHRSPLDPATLRKNVTSPGGTTAAAFDILMASDGLGALMDKAVKGYPYCKAAIDAALYDVVGKALNVPAYQLLGGLVRERVPIAHSLGLMEIDKAVEEALQAKTEGVKTIKLKGGVEQKRDVELVKQIRQALGPDVNICVDANQGYPTAKAAVRITKAMEEFNLLYMEQPVEGIDHMAEVARRVDTPIMADESAWTTQDVIEIIKKKAADMISIYTTKPGGMFKAKKVAAVAEAAGLKCNVNGSVETGVGNAANIHLAASTGVVTYDCVVPVSTPKGKGKSGIAGIYYQDDIITEPFEYSDGDVIVSSKPGLGVEIDEDKLEHYRVS